MRIRKKPRTIIAVDFDGTLVNNHYPFIENPNMELIQFIKDNRYKYTWILHTCRHDKQLEYAIEYMKNEHGITFDFVNMNAPWNIEKYGDVRKIYADFYIDSHAGTLRDFLRQSEDKFDNLVEEVRKDAIWLESSLYCRCEYSSDADRLHNLYEKIMELLEKTEKD